MTNRTRIIKRNIDGIVFTFKCVKTFHTGFDDKKSSSISWWWGADILKSLNVAIGGTHSIKTGIKYQVRAAQMQEIINNR